MLSHRRTELLSWDLVAAPCPLWDLRRGQAYGKSPGHLLVVIALCFEAEQGVLLGRGCLSPSLPTVASREL